MTLLLQNQYQGRDRRHTPTISRRGVPCPGHPLSDQSTPCTRVKGSLGPTVFGGTEAKTAAKTAVVVQGDVEFRLDLLLEAGDLKAPLTQGGLVVVLVVAAVPVGGMQKATVVLAIYGSNR